MNTKRQERTARAVDRMAKSLKTVKDQPKVFDRISKEIENAKNNLAGKKKVKVNKQGVEHKTDDYVIDIFAIRYGYLKNSERRKTKGKSRKKLKKVKTSTFLKTVKSHPGAIQAYRDGRMGLSPKVHTFRVRRATEY